METKNLEFIIHHLFLPKQLPQHYDITSQKEAIFAQHVLTSARKFTECLASEQQPLPSHLSVAWETARRMMDSFALLHANGALNGPLLANRIDQMSTRGSCRSSPLTFLILFA